MAGHGASGPYGGRCREGGRLALSLSRRPPTHAGRELWHSDVANIGLASAVPTERATRMGRWRCTGKERQGVWREDRAQGAGRATTGCGVPRRARAGPYLHQRKRIFAVSVVVLGFGFDREQVIPVYIRQASSFLRSSSRHLPARHLSGLLSSCFRAAWIANPAVHNEICQAQAR